MRGHAPCYKCEERHTECHLHCEKYKKFVEDSAEYYRKRSIEREIFRYKEDSRKKSGYSSRWD